MICDGLEFDTSSKETARVTHHSVLYAQYPDNSRTFFSNASLQPLHNLDGVNSKRMYESYTSVWKITALY